MARARNIKPGFYKNEDLAECSIWARYIFPGLWMLADRDGRLEDRPKRIKGELLPFDSQDIEPLLRELSDKGFILRYQVDGASYIQISQFKKHQSPHYSEKASVIKPPSHQDTKVHEECKTTGTLSEDSEKTDAIKMVSQPPDSLIPDSKPSGSASDLTTVSETHADALLQNEKNKEKPKPTRAGIIASELRKRGIDTSSVREEVIDWAEKNIPDTIIAEAVSIAKERKPNERLSSAYLAPIVKQLLEPKPKKANGNHAWWKDDLSIEKKARELGMWPTNCSTYAELKDKIFDRLREGSP